MKRITTRATRIAAGAVVALSAAVGVAGPVVPAHAAPAPTADSSAFAAADPTTNGPHAYRTLQVSNWSTPGFGSATIYYPETSGTFGAVAIAPGFFEGQGAVSWFGPRLASHGFVVITFNTNSIFDDPDSRGHQLLNALDYLSTRSAVRDKVDATRQAVMGHSMGGGGSLAAAKERPSLKAAIPLTPWHGDKTWPEVSVPTLIIGGESDGIAPVGSHAERFYPTLPEGSEHAYLEINNAGHFVTNGDNALTSTSVVSWLKRFVDGDTSYSTYLCPGPSGEDVEEYRSTCPS